MNKSRAIRERQYKRRKTPQKWRKCFLRNPQPESTKGSKSGVDDSSQSPVYLWFAFSPWRIDVRRYSDRRKAVSRRAGRHHSYRAGFGRSGRKSNVWIGFGGP